MANDPFQSLTGGTVSGGTEFPGGDFGMPASAGIQPNSKVWIDASREAYIGMGGAERTKQNAGITYQEARALPMKWSNEDPGKLSQFVNNGILRKVPGFRVGMGLPEIMSAWDTLLQQSWSMNTSGANNKGNPWTPNDLLNSYSNEGMNYGTIKSGDWIIDARTGEKIKYVGPKSKTSTESRVNLSSPEDVRALTTQMLTELLGRAPTTEELSKYRTSINGYERANPQVATTTQTLNDMGEVTNTATQTSGGASQAALGGLISQEAKKGPEYGKYQAGTTYFNALMQMIGG